MHLGYAHDLRKEVSKRQAGHTTPRGQGHAMGTNVRPCARVAPHCEVSMRRTPLKAKLARDKAPGHALHSQPHPLS